jgi:ketosteroid isomerase-like protein
MPMGEIDDRTVAGPKATLLRAFERGDAALAAALYEPGARVLETVRIDEYGDVAVEEGRSGRRAGERLLDSGKYLAVFRRQPGGAWRWAIDMWNSDAG